MSIIVDTSVIIAVILNEPTKPRIIEATKGHELIAPGCLQWEIGNAFSAMFKRKRISLEQAFNGLKIFKQISMRYPDTDFDNVLRIAFENKIYAYDAYFLSMAQKHKSSFITLDRALQKVALNLGIHLIEVSYDNI